MKNQRNKTGGRISGTPNKITKDIREFFKILIESNLSQIETDLKELTPEKRIEVLLKLSEFVIPKLNKQSVDMEYLNKEVVIEIRGEKFKKND